MREIQTGKYLPVVFPVENGLKQAEALSPLLLNFSLENVCKKVQENQGEVTQNGYQLSVCDEGLNVLGVNINITKEDVNFVSL